MIILTTLHPNPNTSNNNNSNENKGSNTGNEQNYNQQNSNNPFSDVGPVGAIDNNSSNDSMINDLFQNDFQSTLPISQRELKETADAVESNHYRYSVQFGSSLTSSTSPIQTASITPPPIPPPRALSPLLSPPPIFPPVHRGFTIGTFKYYSFVIAVVIVISRSISFYSYSYSSTWWTIICIIVVQSISISTTTSSTQNVQNNNNWKRSYTI